MKTKNLHLPHAEELPLLMGASGLKHLGAVFADIEEYLYSGFMPTGLSLSEKFDGAPAVCIGRDREGIWVGTKAALSKNLARRFHAASEMLEDASMPIQLAHKLCNLLSAIRASSFSDIIDRDSILCGDLSHDGCSPNGVMPNVVFYSPENNLSRSFCMARVGLVLHTIRDAKTLEIISNDIWWTHISQPLGVISASLRRDITPSQEIPESEVSPIGIASPALSTEKLLEIISSDNFLRNTIIKDLNANPSYGDIRERARSTRKTLKLESELHLQTLKTQRGINTSRRNFEEKLSLMSLENTITLLKTLREITQLKESLMSLLPRPLGFKTSLRDGEGFVAHKNDLSFKLVNRREFSLLNRNSSSPRGWNLS